LRRDCNLHRGLGSAQATSAAAEVCCSIEPTSSPRPHIARDRAIELLNTQKLFNQQSARRDISSSRRDQSDVDGAAISRTSSIDVAKKTLIELDQQNEMLKVIDDDSGVALNRVRHHQ
jgi:hypothetical protein